MKPTRSLFILLMGIMGCAGLWPADRVLVLKDTHGVVSAVAFADSFVEQGRHLRVDDLHKPEIEEQFRPLLGQAVDIGPGVRWLRLKIKVPLDQNNRWFLALNEWMLDEVQLYRQLPNGWMESESISLMTELRSRNVSVRDYILRLKPNADVDGQPAVQTFYVRIKASLSLISLPILAGTIGVMSENQTNQTILISFIICAFLVMGSIGAVMLAGTRERVWGIFAALGMTAAFLYLVSSGMSLDILGPVAARALLATYPALEQVYLILNLLLMLSFLNIRKTKSRRHSVVLFIIALCTIIGLFQLFLPESSMYGFKFPAMILSLAIVSLVRIVVPLISIFHGVPMAKIYLIAFTLEIIGSTISVLRSTGMVNNNIWTGSASTMGGILMFIIICYGVSLRLRHLTTEIRLGNARLSVLNEELEIKVRERTRELEEERNKLMHLAMEDELTGLLSRRSVLDQLEQEFQRYRRYGTPFSVLMIDLDHFKRVNDTWGHLAGDQVLRDLAMVLRTVLRDTDKIGRLGGEEIFVVLPETHTGKAMHAAEKVREAMTQLEFMADSGEIFHVTCSIGVAEVKIGHGDTQRILQDSDAAMYRAKQAGRNRIAMAV